ncbi:MAG TPA: hypothetical protein VL501_03075 [Pyrinomonadaceae bacterium]|nr:hypothetical protein [Pyrinomonadaceae bacterium]
MSTRSQIPLHALMIALLGVLMSGATAVAQSPYVAFGDKKVSVSGYITIRDGDSFSMITPDGKNTFLVKIAPAAKIKTNHGSVEFEATYLLRGLRVDVEGPSDSNGTITATTIEFDTRILRSMQTLDLRAGPLVNETAMITTSASAEEIARISAGAGYVQKTSDGPDETTILPAHSATDADHAPADNAVARLNGLKEFETVKTITIPFTKGSFVLGMKARSAIAEAAAWAEKQGPDRWMFEVVGYGDATASPASNIVLRGHRANAVVKEMVTAQKLPVTRLVQPFGVGADGAPGKTTVEWHKERSRVEIRILGNKDIVPALAQD